MFFSEIWRLKLHVVSAIVHGKFVLTNVDYNQFSHGADFTCSMFMEIMLRLGNNLGDTVYIQADNTVKETKVRINENERYFSKFILKYLKKCQIFLNFDNMDDDQILSSSSIKSHRLLWNY